MGDVRKPKPCLYILKGKPLTIHSPSLPTGQVKHTSLCVISFTCMFFLVCPFAEDVDLQDSHDVGFSVLLWREYKDCLSMKINTPIIIPPPSSHAPKAAKSQIYLTLTVVPSSFWGVLEISLESSVLYLSYVC